MYLFLIYWKHKTKICEKDQFLGIQGNFDKAELQQTIIIFIHETTKPNKDLGNFLRVPSL